MLVTSGGHAGTPAVNSIQCNDPWGPEELLRLFSLAGNKSVAGRLSLPVAVFRRLPGQAVGVFRRP